MFFNLHAQCIFKIRMKTKALVHNVVDGAFNKKSHRAVEARLACKADRPKYGYDKLPTPLLCRLGQQSKAFCTR